MTKSRTQCPIHLSATINMDHPVIGGHWSMISSLKYHCPKFYEPCSNKLPPSILW